MIDDFKFPVKGLSIDKINALNRDFSGLKQSYLNYKLVLYK